jgi:hypothetical protein
MMNDDSRYQFHQVFKYTNRCDRQSLTMNLSFTNVLRMAIEYSTYKAFQENMYVFEILLRSAKCICLKNNHVELRHIVIFMILLCY